MSHQFVHASEWSETFTQLKTKADPDGKEQQQRVVKLLGK